MNIVKPEATVAEAGKFGGTFTFTHIRDGKVLDEWSDDNLVPLAGLKNIMDRMFNGGSALSGYIILYSNDYTPLADLEYTDIGTTITEITTYTAATRPAWTSNGAADGTATVSNSSSKASFTFNAGVNIYGAAWVSSSVKGDNTSGVLVAASKLATARTGILSGDVIEVQYDFTATSS